MRVRIAILFGILIVSMPYLALADVLEIPLDLTGERSAVIIETADFAIDLPLDAVTHISLRLEGSYQEVLYQPYYTPYWLRQSLNLTIGDDVTVKVFGEAHHWFPEGEGTFVLEKVLLTPESTDWSFLLDGVGQIGVEADPGCYLIFDLGLSACPLSSWGTLDVATLLVTYDATVPAETQAWGSIKALYRR